MIIGASILIAAFRHRQYEPALKNGWPVALSLTAHLDLGPPLLSTTPAGGREPIVPTGNVVFPVLVTKVEPIYPEKAHLARVEGNVSGVEGDVAFVKGNVRRVTGSVSDVRGNVGTVWGNAGLVKGNVGHVGGDVLRVKGNVGTVRTSKPLGP